MIGILVQNAPGFDEIPKTPGKPSQPVSKRRALAAKLRLKPPRDCAAAEAPLRCQQCLFGPLRGPRHLL